MVAVAGDRSAMALKSLLEERSSATPSCIATMVHSLPRRAHAARIGRSAVFLQWSYGVFGVDVFNRVRQRPGRRKGEQLRRGHGSEERFRRAATEDLLEWIRRG